MKLMGYLIKKFQDKYIIKLNKEKAPQKAIDFATAKKVGILMNVHHESDTTRIFEYAHQLQSEGKEVSVIAYQHKPGPNPATPDGHEAIITKKDLNFFKVPALNKVSFFTDEKFDLLINFCQGSCFPLYFIASVTDAHMKIGNYNEEFVNLYDVMFEVKDNATADDFIRQLNKYMKLIFRQ